MTRPGLFASQQASTRQAAIDVAGRMILDIERPVVTPSVSIVSPA